MRRTSVFPPETMFTKRRLLQATALLALAPAVRSAQPQIALATAINRTARFRALSQRCAKGYTQMFLNVLPDNAHDVLLTTRQLIQSGFDELATGWFSTQITQQLSATRQEADALLELLESPPSKTSLASISAQADKMLLAANRATESLEASARQPAARLVNLAGRQRMLSQRLAKNYFLIAAGLDSKPLRKELSEDKDAFTKAMTLFKSTPLSTPAIHNELSLGQNQWLFFESSLRNKPDDYGLQTVATTSERLLEVMNNLTGLYEAALRDLLGSN